VPYDLAADREHDEAGQFLDMYAVHQHRTGFHRTGGGRHAVRASANGASKTRIRKATGLAREDVAAALKPGRISGFARETAAGFGHAITLEQVAPQVRWRWRGEPACRPGTEQAGW
jgi:hypothetical protein